MLDEYGSLTLKITTIIGAIFILFTIIKNIYNYYNDMSIIVEDPYNVSTGSFEVQPFDIPVITDDIGFTFSISTWLYINNWGYKQGQIKKIWERGPMRLFIDSINNNLVLDVGIYGDKGYRRIEYENFPIQKWMNVVVVIENRKVDLWINGKLYKSRSFENLVYNNANDKLIVVNDGGFNGFISRMYYYKRGLRRSDVLTIFNNDPYATNFISKLWNRILIILLVKKVGDKVN